MDYNINIKIKSTYTIRDSVIAIDNNSNGNYYVVIKDTLRVIKPSAKTIIGVNNLDILTDTIDDIILYHSNALSKFQNDQYNQKSLQAE